MRVETREVYITSDNKEYINREEAERREEYLKSLKYYFVRYGADVSEGRGMQKSAYVTVSPRDNMGHDLMLEEFLYRTVGSPIAYIQGITRTRNWAYEEVQLEEIEDVSSITNVTEINIETTKLKDQ